MAVSISAQPFEAEGYQALASPRFTLRIPLGDVPDWAPGVLQMLEAYQDNPATPPFGPGHKIGAGMPIDFEQSQLEGFLLVPVEGNARLLAVGVSNRERMASDRVETKVLLDLFRRSNPHLVTDPHRGDAFDDPEFDAAFEALVSEDEGSGLAMSGGITVRRAGPATVVECSALVRERLSTVGVEQLGKGADVTFEGPYRTLHLVAGDVATVGHPDPATCQAVLTAADLAALAAWPSTQGVCPTVGGALAFQDPSAGTDVPHAVITTPTGRIAVTLGAGPHHGCEIVYPIPPDASDEVVQALIAAALAAPPRDGATLALPEPPLGASGFTLVDATDEHSDVTLLRIEAERAAAPEPEPASAGPGIPASGSAPLPNPVHYNFAHKVLPALFSMAPKETGAMLHHKPEATLRDTWTRTQELVGAAPEPSDGLELVDRDVMGAMAVFVVRMPPPQTVTEAYFIALAFRDAANFRYLVWERTLDDGAKIGEWFYKDGKPQRRVSGARSADVSLDGFRTAYRTWLDGASEADDAPPAPDLESSTMFQPVQDSRSSLDGVLIGAVLVLLAIAGAAWYWL